MGIRKQHANKIVTSPEQEKLIRDHFLLVTTDVLCVMTGLTKTVLRTWAYEQGLKKIEMEYWNDVQVEFLQFVYPFIGDSEIAEYFQTYWPKNKGWSKKHIDKKRRYLGIRRTPEMLAGIKKRNIMHGCFADCPHKAWAVRGITPIGGVIVRTNQQGKQIAVVKTENGLVHRNPWLWELHYGKVPEGYVVYAAPDVPAICDITDLCLKTKSEVMHIVTQSDITIVKRFFGVKDKFSVDYVIENHSDLIEVKRSVMKINAVLRNNKNKSDGS